MRKSFLFIALLAIFVPVRNSYGHFTGVGHVHLLSEAKQVFSNPDCRSMRTCDLKRFALTASRYEVWFSDATEPTYANGAVMEYETDSVDALEKYAIVQFKKGCVFNSSKERDGRVVRSVTDIVSSFGETVWFCFPHWVIDSQDSDPVYNSDPERGRFYYLRWNQPGSYDLKTEKFYGIEKPKIPLVYMTDYPAGAFVGATGIKNVAMQFRNCIYKAADVPLRAVRDQLDFARPLSCFDWQNIYVYDFTNGSFDTRVANIPTWEEPNRELNPFVLAACGTVLAGLALMAFVARRETFVPVGRGISETPV